MNALRVLHEKFWNLISSIITHVFYKTFNDQLSIILINFNFIYKQYCLLNDIDE